MGSDILAVRSVRAVAVRAPIAVPVRTSFGVMRDRPAVFVALTDDKGRTGLGEVWCNFPSVGAEHRARLANEVVGPLLLSLPPGPVGEVGDRLARALHILRLQSGEVGPLNQVIAGLEGAAWDLMARRAGLPLYAYLGGTRSDVPAYASGIGPEDPAGTAARARAAGHRAFKQKVGFGRDTDLRSLEALRTCLGDDAALMVDANQGWSLDEARVRAAELVDFGPLWLEEPLAADRPAAEWRALKDAVPLPLAAGENFERLEDFSAAAKQRTLSFLQPDLAKWGGLSGSLAVAHMAAAAGLVYCPHYLGGIVGLAASAHCLAAAGGEGLLEVDCNPNPWRERWFSEALRLEDGRVHLSQRPGIGVDLDIEALA